MNTLRVVGFLAREALAAVALAAADCLFDDRHPPAPAAEPLADAEAARDCWEPGELGALVPLVEDIRNLMIRPDRRDAREAWDAELADGLARAARRAAEIDEDPSVLLTMPQLTAAARIAVMAAVIEKHAVWAVNPSRDGYLCGTRTGCGHGFADLDAWALHVAELVDTALTDAPAVAAPRGGGEPNK